jgi:6-pyruvoyltetrahydropterin/6-carboxytetrahydropterin synthase
MFRISKTFEFSAAHRLDGLEQGHPCGRMHGHNYVVELFLEAPNLNSAGFVRDYRELDQFKQWLDTTFDHHLVNEVITQPTAELMAMHIYHRAASIYHEVVAVSVKETGKTTAIYAPHSLPPIDMILDAFESLAAESWDNPERRRLFQAIESLGFRRPGGGGGGGGGAAFGSGAVGGNGGAGGSVNIYPSGEGGGRA